MGGCTLVAVVATAGVYCPVAVVLLIAAFLAASFSAALSFLTFAASSALLVLMTISGIHSSSFMMIATQLNGLCCQKFGMSRVFPEIL